MRCMAYHEEARVYCAVPIPDGELEHEGPHGWDPEIGPAGIIKRRDFERALDAGGLGHLNERLREIEAERNA